MLFATILHNIGLHKSHTVGLITIALPVPVKDNRKNHNALLIEYTNIRNSKTSMISVQRAYCVRNFYFSIKRDRTSETTNVRKCIILLNYTVIFAQYIAMMS